MSRSWRSNSVSIFAGYDTDRLAYVLDVALQSQVNKSIADWGTQSENNAVLESEENSKGKSFSIRSAKRYSLFDSLPGIKRWSKTNLVLTDSLSEVSIKKSDCIGLLLSSHQPTIEEVKFLDQVAIKLRSTKPLAKRIAIFINDALLSVNFPPPPLDARDSWDRICIGEDLGEPPLLRVQNIAMWKGIISELDERWGMRISGLAEQAYDVGYAFTILPISITGFDMRSGLPVDQSYFGYQAQEAVMSKNTISAVPFNITPMIRMLSPQGTTGLPNLLGDGQY